MPQSEIAPGAPCWIDLLTSDPDGAQAFYACLLYTSPSPRD